MLLTLFGGVLYAIESVGHPPGTCCMHITYWLHAHHLLVACRYMAWRDAANTMAFIAGPLIGGQLYRLTGSLATVIGVK